MHSSLRLVVALSVCVIERAAAQAVAPRIRTAADRALITALVAVEDSRDSTVLPTDPRRRGLASVNPYVRAFTVRGLGRIKSATLIPLIQPSLGDSVTEVRAAAADAIAQAAVHGAQPLARAALRSRLSVDRAHARRAALLEAIGRSGGGSADTVRIVAVGISPSL